LENSHKVNGGKISIIRVHVNGFTSLSSGRVLQRLDEILDTAIKSLAELPTCGVATACMT